MGGSSECSLIHNTPSETSTCGPGRVFTQSFDATNDTSFSSTLRGTATTALDGILVECFGPALVRDAGSRCNKSLGTRDVYGALYICSALLIFVSLNLAHY